MKNKKIKELSEDEKETKELENRIIVSFVKHMIKNSKKIGTETTKFINKNFWKLV